MNESNLFVQASSIIPVSFIDFDLLKSIDLDIRIVLTWDSDNTNVELEIIEPNNEICNSFQNCTSGGGMMSRDFSGGYGPVGKFQNLKCGKKKKISLFVICFLF